jgi:uncharacterized phiE125 gp8 family phage protein
MLMELERPVTSPERIAELADFLRLPSGFGDEAGQGPMLARSIAAAIAFVEERSGRALSQRRFAVRFGGWEEAVRRPMPIGPVRSVESLCVFDRTGARTDVDAGLLRIDALSATAMLSIRHGDAPPPIPPGGYAELVVTAGYGPDWRDAPVDLREATLLMAAESFERRGATAEPPVGVLRLLEPYRRVRL